MNAQPAVVDPLQHAFRKRYGRPPEIVAYAPGRVEVLGNHTDYNEGFVLSAAIDRGTAFAVAARRGRECRVTAGDVQRTAIFPVAEPRPRKTDKWANYVIGVHAGLAALQAPAAGYDAMFLGDVPLGSGLSSSAALEISTGLALARLYGIAVDPLRLARIGQAAEHRFAGVRCGLLDQVSSLFGRKDCLVETDFRNLTVGSVPLGEDACFLMCNTHARHALVDGEYNERRAACEAAAAHFARVLPHPVRALRDVSWAEWESHRGGLDQTMARRAAHPIGENERVLRAARSLAAGDLAALGREMFASHESSRRYFENSCPELDAIVEAAQSIPGVLGARLSGGGFGGSAVVLVHPRDAESATAALDAAYARRFGKPCETRLIRPSDGARVVFPV